MSEHEAGMQTGGGVGDLVRCLLFRISKLQEFSNSMAQKIAPKKDGEESTGKLARGLTQCPSILSPPSQASQPTSPAPCPTTGRSPASQNRAQLPGPVWWLGRWVGTRARCGICLVRVFSGWVFLWPTFTKSSTLSRVLCSFGS